MSHRAPPRVHVDHSRATCTRCVRLCRRRYPCSMSDAQDDEADRIGRSVVVVAAPDVGGRDGPGSALVGPPRDTLLRLDGHAAAVTGLAWHPSQPILASSSFDKTALLWDAGSEQAPAVASLAGHTSSVTALAFGGRDGEFVVTVSADKSGAVYDAVTAQRVRALKGHSSHVNAVDGSSRVPDRGAAANAGPAPHLVVTGSNDRSARVWDLRSRRNCVSVAHEYQVLDVAFGQGEWTLCTAGIDPRVRVFDTRKPHAPLFLLEAHGEMVTGLAVSPLGTHLATHGADGRVGVWDVQPFVGGDGERLQRALETDGHGFEDNLMRLGWDRCGTRVAAGAVDGTVLVWDADDGELLYRLTGHSGCVTDVRFCPLADTLVASASTDSSVILGHLPSLLT